VKKKKDAIHAATNRVLNGDGNDNGEGPDSAKENELAGKGGKGKKKGQAKKGKRNNHTSNGGGEEFEVLGTI